MDYNLLLKNIFEDVKPFQKEGQQATYIPELATVDPDQFGIYIQFIDGKNAAFGDFKTKFSIQSISKVLSLVMALSKKGPSLWERVRVEPSGTAFNSLIQLEMEKGIPRNPFINAGALVVCDVLLSEYEDPKSEFIKLCRQLSGNDNLNINHRVFESEKATGFRNTALANFLKSFNNLHNPVEEVLDFYYFCCSMEMTCRDLARTFLYFANHGSAQVDVQLTRSQIKRINAIMLTCGFYDEAGDFAFRVGLPGKSGVGGGIAAVHTGFYSVAVWSPRLNAKGNSVLGFKALELLTTELRSSIF